MQQQPRLSRFARWYLDWCVVGTLACAIAGFPGTPLGPLFLWAVVLPGLAGWLAWRFSSVRPQGGGERIGATRPLPVQAWRKPLR